MLKYWTVSMHIKRLCFFNIIHNAVKFVMLTEKYSVLKM